MRDRVVVGFHISAVSLPKGIDAHIEQPDDDLEPRDICQSCERDIDAQGHAIDCEWHPDFYENPERYDKEDDCDA